MKNFKLFAGIGVAALLLAPIAGIAHDHGGKKYDKGAKAGKSKAKGDIVQTAQKAGSFNTLLSLAKEAGLVDALKGRGPLTVFAPTDEAFKKVPAATLQALKNDRELLRRVLLYHVVQGDVKAAQVVNLNSANTLAGQPVRIRVVDGKVRINDSTVIKADVGAKNGTIHVIDTVLIPQQ